MNVKQWLTVRDHALAGDVSLLLVRLVGGVAFMIHGWGKIQNPFAWMGAEAPIPGFLQALAAVSEFGGGLAWVLGLLTPLACLGMASTMAVAAYMHAFTWGDPFVAKGGGGSYELALVYFCVAALLFALGPGRLSLDRVIFGARAE